MEKGKEDIHGASIFLALSFISDGVAAWQSNGKCGTQLRNHRGLGVHGSLCQPVQSWQWTAASQIHKLMTSPNAGLPLATISVPGVSTSFI
jgi:hypothetical protein